MAKSKKFDITALLDKKYKKCVFTGDHLRNRERHIYSLGPRLDFSLNGGIAEGTMNLFAGKTGCGKTTLALYVANQFIKRGCPVFYQDVEHRLEKKHTYSVYGFTPEDMHVIRSDEDMILETEDYYEIGLVLAGSKENRNGLLIVDSLDALIPKAVTTAGNVSGTRRAPNARITSDFIRQATPYCCVNNFTIVFIAHLYDNISGMGGPSIGGGTYAQFQCDNTLLCYNKPSPVIEDDRQVGQTTIWQILKSGLASPVKDVETYFRYGYGIDEITELVQMILVRQFDDLLSKAGAWYELNFLDEPIKVQGMAKLFQWFVDNPDELDKLKAIYRERTL